MGVFHLSGDGEVFGHGQKYAAFKRLSKTPFKESVQSPSPRRAFIRRMDGHLASDQDIEMLKRILGVEVEREQIMFSRPPSGQAPR